MTNETDVDLNSFYYDVNCTVGDAHPETAAYLHAHWRRETPTTFMEDYTILPQVEGHGRFLGCNLGVIADTGRYYRSWWGEGEVKVYLDGDTSHPTLCGTGTEDYIGTGWGQGAICRALSGVPRGGPREIPLLLLPPARPGSDLVPYLMSCHHPADRRLGPASMAQMYAAGLQLVHSDKPLDMAGEARARTYGLFERQDDVSSCAWFYLNRPTNDLPALPPAEERFAGLG